MDASEVAALVLERSGLPGGLLPLPLVVKASLASDGCFEVRLRSEHERAVHTLRVWYTAQVSGRIEHGRVTELVGIEAQECNARYAVDTICASEGDTESLMITGSSCSGFIPTAAFA